MSPPRTSWRWIRWGEGDDVRVVGCCAKVQRAVGACGVVGLGVLGEGVPQVLLVVDEHPVGALSPVGADNAVT